MCIWFKSGVFMLLIEDRVNPRDYCELPLPAIQMIVILQPARHVPNTADECYIAEEILPKKEYSPVRPPKAYPTTKVPESDKYEPPSSDLQTAAAEGRLKTMSSKTKQEIKKNYSTIKDEDEQLTKILQGKRSISWYIRAVILLPLMFWCGVRQQPYTQPIQSYEDGSQVNLDDFMQNHETVTSKQNHEHVNSSVSTAQAKPTLVISYAGQHGAPWNLTEHFDELAERAKRGDQVVFITEQWSEWSDTIRGSKELNGSEDLTWIDGSGNISCCCTPALQEFTDCWLNRTPRGFNPPDTSDVFTSCFDEIVQLMQYEATMNLSTECTALVSEMHEELLVEQGEGTLDAADDPEDIYQPSTEQDLAQERAILEEIPLPGTNTDERLRKELWLKLLRAAGAAIRRSHQ